MKTRSLVGWIVGGVIVIAMIGFGLKEWIHVPIDTPDDQRITVAATIFPIADIVKQVGGDDVRVVLMMPPGASPHSYSLSPQQISDVQNASTVFMVGHGLDDYIVRDVQRVVRGDVTVRTVDDGISLRRFDGGHGDHSSDGEEDIDPHYWLTAVNAQQITRTVEQELIALDPDHADTYRQRAQSYIARLDVLERELQEMVSQTETTQFVAMHDAWGYFTDQYGLELVATYQPIEGREPSPLDLQELQQAVERHELTTFFVEPQKRTSAAARFVRDELGLSVAILDPVGGTGDHATYIDMMRENVNAIASQSAN